MKQFLKRKILYVNMMCSSKSAYAEEGCKMAINLETALKIARKILSDNAKGIMG